MDDHLRPHVESLPTYLKDTIHLLNILDGLHVDTNTLLVCIDVVALYSSIPHQLGLTMVRSFLDERTNIHQDYNMFILKLLEFILTHNAFIFYCFQYLQMQGVAMGIICALFYAKLYLGGWEWTIFGSEDLSMYFRYVSSWQRYIDDILIF